MDSDVSCRDKLVVRGLQRAVEIKQNDEETAARVL